MKVFIASFFLLLFCSLSPNPVFAQPVCQVCAPIGNFQEYQNCLLQPGHVLCGTPTTNCCYIPPSCIATNPVCPAPTPIPPTPLPGTPAPSPIPTLPPGAPTPTIYIGPPPGTCGDHLLPCCGIQYGGDPGLGECNPLPPSEPQLFCTGIVLGESICCLRIDPDRRCFTGLGVTPAPQGPQFCRTAEGFGVASALGCLISSNPRVFVRQLLTLALSLSGGIALLIIIYSGFQVATAGGDPKKVQASKELVTAAITGIIFLAFCVTFLNFIGVQILGLQNLGFRS